MVKLAGRDVFENFVTFVVDALNHGTRDLVVLRQNIVLLLPRFAPTTGTTITTRAL